MSPLVPIRTYDQQVARLRIGKFGVDFVVGKGENFRCFAAESLDNIPERVLSRRQKALTLITQKSGDDRTEKSICVTPLHSGAKSVTMDD